MYYLLDTYILFTLFTWILCARDEQSCDSEQICSDKENKYSREINEWSSRISNLIKLALEDYQPCDIGNCSCHRNVINNDLKPFSNGISKEMNENAMLKGTKYQIIDGVLYRQKDCQFPSRCAGIEHYLKTLATKLPNMEMSINTRDWPQVNHAWGHVKLPVFSFSKYWSMYETNFLPVGLLFHVVQQTKDNYDIMYPAWSFWEGGPAIALYPTGIGRWDKHRLSISTAADKWPWDSKEQKAFFRGSRTNEERDNLILLSRYNPSLVDAQYTKNQAWKSDADTLHAVPAKEVSFEDHCKYKYLFNYRGIAASFRFKHLFLCKSLVFHVGDEWLEFFYPSLKPWVHYVPINPKASQEEISKYIMYFKSNDALAREIAERGFKHIWEHLTDKDVMCYWRILLKKYAKLLNYPVVLDSNLIKV